MNVARVIQKMNNANGNYVYTLTELSRKRFSIKATDSNGVLDSALIVGKIDGYLESLVDMEVINKYDKKILYHHYAMSRP